MKSIFKIITKYIKLHFFFLILTKNLHKKKGQIFWLMAATDVLFKWGKIHSNTIKILQNQLISINLKI